MERTDGLLVAIGTAAMGDHSTSALRTMDQRACDPSELRILKDVHPGQSLGVYEERLTADRQFDQFDHHLISDPLDFYRTGSHWGDVVACPSTLVHFLWGLPMAGLRPSIGSAVGLFGAIEVGHVNGPLVLNRDYRIESQVVSVGQSPKTEYLWFDSWADDEEGKRVVDFRMQLRFMKASSPLYGDDTLMLRVGDRAPAFDLEDQEGEPVSLDLLLANGPLVIYFYPADFAGMNAQACRIRDMHDEIIAAGQQVVGVSPQGVSSKKRFQDAYNLPFRLIADPRKKLIRAFGVDGLLGFGVRRATFLVDTDGVIRERHVSDFDPGSHASFVGRKLKDT